jgi:hypothetical protein
MSYNVNSGVVKILNERNKKNNEYIVNSEVVKLLKERKIDIKNINYNEQYETRDHNKKKKDIYFHNKSNVSDNLSDSLKEFYRDKYLKR